MSNQKSFLTVRELCATALGAALMTICAWISIPAQVPFTLQTFAVFFVTALLGLKCGTLSVIVYLLLGAVGLPVFAGFKGGLGSLMGVTGGYLLGFCVLGAGCGTNHKVLWSQLSDADSLYGAGTGAVLCLWLRLVPGSLHPDQGRHYHRRGAQRLRDPLSDSRRH